MSEPTNEPTPEEARRAMAETIVAQLPQATVFAYHVGQHGGPDTIDLHVRDHWGQRTNERFMFFDFDALNQFVAFLARRELAAARETLADRYKDLDTFTERMRACEALVAKIEAAQEG